MLTIISKLTYQSMERNKSCNNCQDQVFCQIEGTEKGTACNNWQPEFEEYQIRWKAVECYLQGKSIEEAAKSIQEGK